MCRQDRPTDVIIEPGNYRQTLGHLSSVATFICVRSVAN